MNRPSQIAWILFKTAIFTALAPVTVGILLPGYIYEAFGPQFDGHDYGIESCPAWCSKLMHLSPAFLILGAVIYLWCAWDFASKGMGTPAPIDAPKKLVVNGLYRFVRNPMYLGVLCLILSQILGRPNYSRPILIYFLFVFACFHFFILLYEERRLKKLFGEQYEEYCRNVPRWIPRLRPFHDKPADVQ
jgi:protein-S-isoprenylcysteine O-methyltransferase Ste14